MIKLTRILILLLASAAGISGKAHAQDTPYSDINSIPLREKAYAKMEGSPYLNDQWIKGTVTFQDGKTAKNVDLKFDQVQGFLVFKNDLGHEFMFVTPVKEFELPLIGKFRSGFPPSKGTNEKTFFKVLNDGETKLLKSQVKNILETKAFYSGVVEKTVVEEIKFYILKSDNKLVLLKNDKKSLLSELKNKESELEKYIRNQNLSVKNEEDLVNLFAYYNSL